MTLGLALAILGAAISIALGGLGTVFGTLHVARAGTGLVAEKPQSFGLVLLFSALPSSQGIYGFLGSILILQQIGFLAGETPEIALGTGLVLFFASLPVGLLGLFSGSGQGQVLQSGLRIIAKNPGDVGKAVILGVLMESMAVFGLLLSILIVNSVNV